MEAEERRRKEHLELEEERRKQQILEAITDTKWNRTGQKEFTIEGQREKIPIEYTSFCENTGRTLHKVAGAEFYLDTEGIARRC